MSERLVYLYAITGPDGRAVRAEDTLESRPLRFIEESGLVALVADVPAVAYEQGALDENVRDPGWLTPRAAGHAAVNAAAHEATEASLPVPFGTIFRGDERLREMLLSHADELHARLEAVRGRGEWVAGVYRDTPKAAEHLSRVREAVAAPQALTVSAGRRYLEERKNEAARRDELRRLDQDAAEASQGALEPVSKRAFDEPVVDTEGDLVARATYLVRRVDEHRFRDAVERFNRDWDERGYQLRVTGPWPAYRSSGVTL